MRELLKAENSLLYRDLERNTAGGSGWYYKLERENRLVYALFSDFDRAVSLDVYKPIGDGTREILQDKRESTVDEYNKRRLTEQEKEEGYIYSDPLFVGIQYFDLLVREAFKQKVDWHVWLSYYESFTREICRNYRITEYSDPDAEWPNDYSRLLYEMISNMRDWIHMMEEEASPDIDNKPGDASWVVNVSSDEEPETQSECRSDTENDGEQEEPSEHISESENDSQEYGDYIGLTSTNLDKNDKNIPGATAIAIFSCHKEILSTPSIPTKFKAYITMSVFECVLDLRKYERGSLQWKYSELMLNCLKDNLSDERTDQSYKQSLVSVYEEEFNGHPEYGVRSEIRTNDLQGTGLVSDLDEIIGYES